MATVNEKMTAIADSIRAKTGGTELLNLDQMASAVGEVYEAGKRDGAASGGDTTAAYNEGFEAGKQAEYDAFWDGAQKNGTGEVYYGYAFCSRALWTQERIEKVKYKHLIASYFAVVFNGNTSLTDLSMFTMESYIMSNGNHATISISSCFSGCTNLVKCMPINFGFVNAAPNAFNQCSALEELIVSGTIKVSDLNLKDSPKLNKASITSIINALSTTTTGLTVTLSKTAKEAAFTNDEWAALIATKTNWTISLV